MEDLTNIWNTEDELSNEELVNYLKDKLSEEEKHAAEEKILQSSFASDAVEGLQQIQDKQKIDDYVYQLNKHLHQQLAQKKAKHEKRKIKNLQWAIYAVIFIIIVCIAAYFIIRMQR